MYAEPPGGLVVVPGVVGVHLMAPGGRRWVAAAVRHLGERHPRLDAQQGRGVLPVLKLVVHSADHLRTLRPGRFDNSQVAELDGCGVSDVESE